MTTSWGEPFTERDEPMLACHGLTLADAIAAQLSWVSDEEGASLLGQRRSTYRDFSGIVFPFLRDGRVISYQLRLNNPQIEESSNGGEPKEKNKYLFPPGERGHLYLAPTVNPEWLDNTAIDVLVTEGCWKTLAAHRLAFAENPTDPPRWLAVGLAGVWNFLGRTGKSTNANGKRVDTHGPIPDLMLIKWVGRRVKIVFDSDVTTNSAVSNARLALGAELIRRGAIVEFIDVPDSPDGSKQGLDDWLGIVGAKPVLDALAHGKLFDLSADNVLSIVKELPETATLAELGEALSNMAQMIAGGGKLVAALVREGCIRALRDRGISAPAKMVDAAIGDGADSAPTSSDLFLTDPEPWEEPVNGADLLNEMVAIQQRFVSAERTLYHTVALWTLFTHAFENFYCLPILLITAATKRAGKSTLLAVLSALVRRPLPASNLTEAVLFRVTEEYKPTLLLDECDAFLRDNEPLRGLINSGHTPQNAKVLRCVGDSHEVEAFSTRAPKALAGIGNQADTIMDRSVIAKLKRATASQRREHLRLDRLDRLEHLRRKAVRWSIDNADTLRIADPDIPNEITNDRARDNWRTLFAVADAAGGEWPRLAREAALATNENDENQSAAEQLICDLFVFFTELEGYEKIESARIAEYLHGLENRSWAEWGRLKKPITPVGIARLLKGHDIEPAHWRDGDKTLRGYCVADFEDAFNRYCRKHNHAANEIPVGTLGTHPIPNNLQEADSAQCNNPVPSRFERNSLEPKDCDDCAESSRSLVASATFHGGKGIDDRNRNVQTPDPKSQKGRVLL